MFSSRFLYNLIQVFEFLNVSPLKCTIKLRLLAVGGSVLDGELTTVALEVALRDDVYATMTMRR